MLRIHRIQFSVAVLLVLVGGVWLFSDRTDAPQLNGLEQPGLVEEPQGADATESLSMPANAPSQELALDQSSDKRKLVGELSELIERDGVPSDFPLTLQFQVLGPHGEPIPGAVVNDSRKSKSRATRTDDEGHGEFVLRKAAGEKLWFAALGFKEAKVLPSEEDLQASAQGHPLIVHLERDTLLTLNFRGPGSLVGFSVEVGAPEGLLTRGLQHLGDLQVASGATPYGWARGGRGREQLNYYLGDSGQIVLPGVGVDVSLKLRVLDTYLSVVHEEELAPMVAMESRTHEVVIDGEPHEFSFAVRNEAGVALEGVEVVLRFSEKSWRALRTDEDGLLPVTGLWADYGILEMTLAGYVPIYQPEWEIPGGGAQVEFQMLAGHTVQVRVQDRAGNLAPSETDVKAIVEGHKEFKAEDMEGGGYRLEDLPATILELRARVGGRTYTMEHDTTIGEATFVIPDHGSIDVDVPYALEGDLRLCLIPQDEDARPTRQRVPKGVHSFEWLSPGEYLVCVQRLSGNKGWDWKERIEPIPITVRPGERHRVKLGAQLPD